MKRFITLLVLVSVCCGFLGLSACSGCVPTPPDIVTKWPVEFRSAPKVQPSGYVLVTNPQPVAQPMPIAVPQPPIQYVPAAAPQPCR